MLSICIDIEVQVLGYLLINSNSSIIISHNRIKRMEVMQVILLLVHLPIVACCHSSILLPINTLLSILLRNSTITIITIPMLSLHITIMAMIHIIALRLLMLPYHTASQLIQHIIIHTLPLRYSTNFH